MGKVNVIKVVKLSALNLSTGGLYSIAKAGEKAVETGKVLSAAADAFASTGVAGNVLQPAVGTQKALIIEGAVAGTALAIAGPAAFSTSGFGAAAAPEGTLAAGATYSTGTLGANVSGIRLVSTGPELIGVTQSSLQAVPSGFVFTPVTDYTLAGVTAASVGEPVVAGGGLLAGITQGLTTVGKFLGTTVATAYIGKVIVGGQKAIGDILRGDFGQAVDDLVGGLDPTRGSGPTNRAVTGGGYGGGGGGGGYYGATGQQPSSMLSTVLPIGMVLIAVLVGVYFYRRKK